MRKNWGDKLHINGEKGGSSKRNMEVPVIWLALQSLPYRNKCTVYTLSKLVI